MPNLQGGHGMQSSMMQPKNSKSPIGGGLDHIGSQIIGEHRRNTQEDVSNLYWGFITILLTLSFFLQMNTSMSPARQHESSLSYASPGRTSAKELQSYQQ